MITPGKEMPAQLTAEQKNVQHAMVAMVENHLHWYDHIHHDDDLDDIDDDAANDDDDDENSVGCSTARYGP